MIGGAHARQHQDLRRCHSASAEDDLVALDLEDLAAALNLDADGPLALEQDAAHNDIGLDRQVQLVAHRARNVRAVLILTPSGLFIGMGPTPPESGAFMS